MKNLLLIALTLLTMSAKSQKCICCDKDFDRIVNITGGNPFNLNMDFGLAFDHLSYYGGIKIYQTSTVTKQGQEQNGLPITVYGKIAYKIINGNVFRAYLNAYGGYKVYGVGLRLGFIVNPDIMITIEPGINHKEGNYVNGGISIRF